MGIGTDVDRFSMKEMVHLPVEASTFRVGSGAVATAGTVYHVKTDNQETINKKNLHPSFAYPGEQT